MLRELPLNPPCDKWEEYTKPEFIQGQIFDLCEDIVKRGYRTNYPQVYALIYEYLEENIEKFYPQPE